MAATRTARAAREALTNAQRSYQAGDLASALASYGDAVQLDPRLADAYGSRALVRELLCDADGAVADYDAALRLDPSYAFAYVGRARARLAATARSVRGGDRLDEALSDIEAAMCIAPGKGGFLASRAAVKEARGDRTSSEEDYAEAVRSNGEAIALHWRGRTRVAMGGASLSLGLQDVERSLELSQKGAPLYNGAQRTRDWAEQRINRQRRAFDGRWRSTDGTIFAVDGGSCACAARFAIVDDDKCTLTHRSRTYNGVLSEDRLLISWDDNDTWRAVQKAEQL